MQTVVIAGGKGTRLGPISGIIPKLLLPLIDGLLIDYLIKYLVKNNCKHIIICTGYLGDKIKEHIKKNNYGIKTVLSQEKKPMGTAGALSLIRKRLNETFLVFYGDVVTTMNIPKLLKFHLKNQADCTIVIRKTDHPKDSNLVSFNKNWLVERFHFKPHKKVSSLEYGLAAIYMFNPEVLRLLPKTIPLDLEKDFLPILLKNRKKLVCYNTDEFIYDIGTPGRYKKILELFKK